MSKCNVCGDETDVIVNIRFKAIPVCDPCCLAITKQTVASLTETTLKADQMRVALMPFAQQAKIIDENDEIHRLAGKREDATMFRFADSYSAITLGDCRDARIVLEGNP